MLDCFNMKNLHDNILDAPLLPERPEVDPATSIIIYAWIATGAIVQLITMSRLPSLADWQVDWSNQTQTFGQIAYLISIAATAAIFFLRQWIVDLKQLGTVLVFLFAVYAYLQACAMIVAIKFWAEPQNADQNRDTLHHLPFACLVFVLIYGMIRYNYLQKYSY